MRSAERVLLVVAAAVLGSRWPAGQDPSGWVRDERGEAVAGARLEIELRVDSTGANAFGQAAAGIVWRHPLPVVRSRADGSFSIPLHPEHRLLAADAGWCFLRVHKPGYQPWVEPLPGGLMAYRGSRVVLRRLRPAETAHLQARDAPPGAGVVVRREWAAGWGAPPRWVALDADGTARVSLPSLPSPLVRPRFALARSLSWEARIEHPAAATAWRICRPGRERWQVVSASNGVELRRRDGAPLEDLRVLARCADGRGRWFRLPKGELPVTPMPVLAIEAAGCRAAGPGSEVLEPLQPRGEAPARLVVRDPAGRPVEGVAALLLAAEDAVTIPSWMLVGEPRERLPVALRVERHRVEIPARLPERLARVLVMAPGHRPVEILDPRGVRGEEVVELPAFEKRGRIVIFAHDEQGKPLAGVRVLLANAAWHPAMLAGEPLRTGADGRLLLAGVPAGPLRVRLLGEGLECYTPTAVVRAGEASELDCTLAEGRDRDFVLEGPDGDPAPFTACRRLAAEIGCAEHVPIVPFSDSVGRLRLPRMSVGLGEVLEGDVTRREGEAASRLRVEGVRPLWLAFPWGRRVGPLRGITWTPAGPGRFAPGGMHMPVAAREGGDVLLWWQDGLDEISVDVQGEPPVRLTREAFSAWRARVRGRLVRQPPPGVVRRVPLAVPLRDRAGKILVWRIQGRPAPPRGRTPPQSTTLSGGSDMAARCPGGWCFVARDRGAYDAVLLHPDYEPTPFHVPAQEEGVADRRLVFRPLRGAALRVRVDAELSRRLPSHLVFTLRDPVLGAPRTVLLERPRAAPPGTAFEVAFPFALPVGVETRISLTSPQVSRRAAVTPARATPVLVELH